jgi:hypothetical protein
MFYVDTLSPDNNKTIPTVTDSLFTSGAIPEHLVALYLLPLNINVSILSAGGDNLLAGEITWGLCIYHLLVKLEP